MVTSDQWLEHLNRTCLIVCSENIDVFHQNAFPKIIFLLKKGNCGSAPVRFPRMWRAPAGTERLRGRGCSTACGWSLPPSNKQLVVIRFITESRIGQTAWINNVGGSRQWQYEVQVVKTCVAFHFNNDCKGYHHDEDSSSATRLVTSSGCGS